jgi:hypothetical protein
MPYDPTQADAISRMRYKVGDTDNANPLEPDSTYQAVLDIHGEDLGVGVIAQGLAVRYSQKPSSVSTDEGTFVWNDRVRAWLTLAKTVQTTYGQAAGTAGTLLATRASEPTSEYVRASQTIGTGWWTE